MVKVCDCKMFPVFVDKIPESAKVSDLRKLFSDFKSVADVAIVKYHGFVTFHSASEALEAIKRLNGSRLNGSRVIVEASHELEEFIRSQRRSHDSRPIIFYEFS